MDNEQIEEFFKRCRGHDWWYMMTEDHSVWQRGWDAQHKLERDAKADPKLKLIFDQWQAHVKENMPEPRLEDFLNG